MRALLIPLAICLPLHVASAGSTLSFTNSQQDVLNGASAVMATANYGKGVVFGDIDTGIVSQWIGFTPAYNGVGLPNINTSQSAVCIGACPTGAFPTDGNGHGTFTASEMVGGVPGAGILGMAPAATLIAVQVLNAQGSGNASDAANGIVYAANHGAQVLNLSLGPSGSAAQQAAFYESLAPAINYAASKGVYVVFAGGNSSQAFAGGTAVTGFTNTALQHMLFMGSTNASERLSSFSNTPGSGYFLSTSGTKYSYSSMWMMADGENIWGASNYYSKQYGYSYITQMSGTSMAAPQGAGAIGLLLAEWPVLYKNGTAAQVLEASGTYLGASTTYGDGYLNLAKAFSPIGPMSVLQSNGVDIPIRGTSIAGGGALGSLPGLAASLSNYTAFDSFQRNFALNLSGLIQVRPSPAAIVGLSSAAQAFTNTVHFADGSALDFTGGSPNAGAGGEVSASAPAQWASTLTTPSGTTVAAGNGLPASAAFAGALWGGGSVAAAQTPAAGASNALLDLAQGGAFAAYGTETGSSVRFAFAWSSTPEVQPGLLGSNWAVPNASAASTGASWTMTDGWKAGLTFGTLGEHNGLLGSAYAPDGPLNFGSQNRSLSIGASSVADLGGNFSLLVDAGLARADGSNPASGIVSGVSPLYARSFGTTLTEASIFTGGDALSLMARAPLRVFSGSAELTAASVDAQGNPVLSGQRIGLSPTGIEMDFTAGYRAPLGEASTWNVSLEGRLDPNNVAGTYDVTAVIGAKFRF